MKRSQKIFSEVRFSGQLSIVEDLGKVIRQYFPSHLLHWQIENNQVVRLFNDPSLSNSTEIVLIDHSKFVYSVEACPTNNYFKDRLLMYYKLVEKFIESNDVIRIGVRSMTLIEQPSKEHTISKYSGVHDSDFLASFGQAPTDYFNVLQFENQRVTFGPLAKNENNRYQNEFNDKSKFTDNMMLFDVDCFRQKTPKKEVVKILDKLIAQNKVATDLLENRFKD